MKTALFWMARIVRVAVAIVVAQFVTYAAILASQGTPDEMKFFFSGLLADMLFTTIAIIIAWGRDQ